MEMMGILQIELMYSYIICIDSCFWFKANKNSIRLSFANPVKVLINVNLESQERKHTVHKDHLSREQRYLRRRLEHLHLNKRRSVSECSSISSSTNSTSSQSSRCTLSSAAISSPSSISESDEVDVTGYTSNQSDTDDQSASSDSGVAIHTSRLTLSEMDYVLGITSFT
ncbi:hypothetical protein M8J75_001279 [Diaphorina citri]|nr:hypothetical protein M8J75_001279 [Diaphorina citri]